MAGAFYSLEEVMDKLGMSEAEVRELIQNGRIREFRDGAKQLFKTEEIDEFADSQSSSEIDLSADSDDIDLTPEGEGGSEDEGDEIELAPDDEDQSEQQPPAGEPDKSMQLELDETGEISLQPDESAAFAADDNAPSDEEENIPDLGGDQDQAEAEPEFDLSELSKADTNVGTTGINVLGDTDDDYKLADDTRGETKIADAEGSGDLGSLDDDLNMDSAGSGSGLLDLSLQADDTSLGAVLDDILPGGESGGAVEAAAAEMAAEDEEAPPADETDNVFEESAPEPAPEQEQIAPVAASPAAMPRYVEIPPDSVSNACGVSLFVPTAGMILAAVIIFAAFQDAVPAFMNAVQGEMWGMSILWYVVIGMAVFCLFIVTVGAAMGGSGSGTKTKKKPKAKKEKPKKEKKPKKSKKKK